MIEQQKHKVVRTSVCLDAFVWADFDLNDGNNPLSVRIRPASG